MEKQSSSDGTEVDRTGETILKQLKIAQLRKAIKEKNEIITLCRKEENRIKASLERAQELTSGQVSQRFTLEAELQLAEGWDKGWDKC